jgi:5'(3')-deoxyribonucleotidase
MNVDVDLVVADALPCWLNWFKENSRDNIEFDFEWHKESYHLSKTMKLHMDIDPEKFWWQKSLYNTMPIMKYSSIVLSKLSEYYEIRFITCSHNQDKDSKNRFIMRYFPFHSGIYHIPAEEKWEFEADVWVEDRVSTLDSITLSQPNCKVFHLLNDMNRKFIVKDAIRVDDWREIGRRLL